MLVVKWFKSLQLLLSYQLRRGIVRDGAWVAVGQLIAAAAAVASIRMMTELIAPEEYGRLMLLVGVSALALGVTANPRLQALMRYYPDWSRIGQAQHLRNIVGKSIAIAVAIAAVTISGIWFVVAVLLKETWFTGFLIAALLVADTARSFVLSLLNATRQQRSAAAIYAADAWSRPLMAIAAVSIFGSNANAALGGYAAGSALVTVLMQLAMRWKRSSPLGPVPEFPENERDISATVRRYALPLIPLGVLGWVSGVGDRYVLGGSLGLQEAGLYAAAYGLASQPFLMMAGVVELTMRPVLQNAIASGSSDLVARTKRRFLLLVASGATCGVLGFLFLSDAVGHLLLAPDFRGAVRLMPWIAFGYALYITSNVYSRFCYAFDDTRAVLFLTATGAVAGLLILVPATQLFGLLGAAAVAPIRFGVELTLSRILARRAEKKYFASRQY